MAQEEHARLSLLEFNYSTIGVHVSMVSTWNGVIRGAVFVSALAVSVELAQTCLGAVRFLTAPAVHVCSNNEASDSARIITCAGAGADLRVFMLAIRDAPIRVVIVAARVKTVSSHKDALAAKKKKCYTNIKSKADNFGLLLY